MTLEEPAILKEKNRRRLLHVTYITFGLGVNVTSPSKIKDSLRVISVILIVFGCMELYGHIAYINRYKESILAIAESVCTFFQTLISMFKLCYFIFVQRRFYLILNKAKTHELVDKIPFLSEETPYNKKLRTGALKILERCWSIASMQFYFYAFCILAIVSCYFFGAIGINTYNAIIGNTNHTNVFAFPTLFPFWEDKMNEYPYYPILTFVVGMGDYIAGMGPLSFDGMFIFVALHIVALFRILHEMIRFTTSENVPKELRIDYLRQCILHYQRTYDYCMEFNNLYLHLSLVVFLLSLIIYGSVILQLTFGLETDFTMFLRMVVYISAAGFAVVIFCANSQLITDETEALTFTWYDCEWYNESREFKWLINMMLMRSNRTLHMKCSWFTTMSLPTLMAIIRTSSSCFLLLRNFAFDDIN